MGSRGQSKQKSANEKKQIPTKAKFIENKKARWDDKVVDDARKSMVDMLQNVISVGGGSDIEKLLDDVKANLVSEGVDKELAKTLVDEKREIYRNNVKKNPFSNLSLDALNTQKKENERLQSLKRTARRKAEFRLIQAKKEGNKNKERVNQNLYDKYNNELRELEKSGDQIKDAIRHKETKKNK